MDNQLRFTQPGASGASGATQPSLRTSGNGGLSAAGPILPPNGVDSVNFQGRPDATSSANEGSASRSEKPQETLLQNGGKKLLWSAGLCAVGYGLLRPLAIGLLASNPAVGIPISLVTGAVNLTGIVAGVWGAVNCIRGAMQKKEQAT